MKIDIDITNQLGVEECWEEKRFFSRRNEVYLCSSVLTDETRMQFVYKTYIFGDKENEYRALSSLHGRRVPGVLAQGGSTLCLEFIPGLTLLECMEKAEQNRESSYGLINCFLEFLQGFYESMPGIIYGDVNLRNFIVSGSCVYGVDLEETRPGNPETDIGRAAAFMLTYDPVTPYKRDCAEYLIRRAAERFNFDIKEAEREKEKELREILIRRGGEQ